MRELIEQLKALTEAGPDFVHFVTYKPVGGKSKEKAIGLRASYNSKWKSAVKNLPQGDRMWDDTKSEWVADYKHYQYLFKTATSLFGMEPEESEENVKAADNPFMSKNQVALIIDKKWIVSKTPWNQAFLKDLKAFFATRKYDKNTKRWKVPFSKENRNMMSYLIKRHYKQAPEILKA